MALQGKIMRHDKREKYSDIDLKKVFLNSSIGKCLSVL